MDRHINAAAGADAIDANRPQAAAGGSQLLSAAQCDELSRKLQLSNRELGLVKAVLDDLPAFAIARRWGISANTVNTHFHRLYSKLGVSSRVGLVTLVLAGYLSIPHSV